MSRRRSKRRLGGDERAAPESLAVASIDARACAEGFVLSVMRRFLGSDGVRGIGMGISSSSRSNEKDGRLLLGFDCRGPRLLLHAHQLLFSPTSPDPRDPPSISKVSFLPFIFLSASTESIVPFFLFLFYSTIIHGIFFFTSFVPSVLPTPTLLS